VLIDVVIPTVDRDELLGRAIRGVCEQLLSGAKAKIIVIDNSPDGRQRAVVDALDPRVAATMEVRYFHEPRPGLAYSRNRGVAESDGDFVVFLDDDECPADPAWLLNLVHAAEKTGADAAFGPVIPRFEAAPTQVTDFVTSLYTRQLARSGLSDITASVSSLGTGNSCFRRQSCFPPGEDPFHHTFDKTGGEDVDLLYRLQRGGKRFVWAVDASVFEFVPKSRLSKNYLSDRRFRQGQQRAYLQIASPPRRYDALLFWMAVGAAQAAYHGTAKIVARIFGTDEAAARHGVQYWGGVGKILWQSAHRREKYGIQRNV
jgi:succinoglycan biosynthesis protein ExoM